LLTPSTSLTAGVRLLSGCVACRTHENSHSWERLYRESTLLLHDGYNLELEGRVFIPRSNQLSPRDESIAGSLRPLEGLICRAHLDRSSLIPFIRTGGAGTFLWNCLWGKGPHCYHPAYPPYSLWCPLAALRFSGGPNHCRQPVVLVMDLVVVLAVLVVLVVLVVMWF
jgi:hypothetical protein